MRKAIAQEGKLATLAFSEFGSRSHFWLPVSTATKGADGIRLNAAKQLITSAGVCDIYVWSSKPAAADGLSSLWAVPADARGLTIPKPYVGLGLRGNCSAPITAKDVLIPEGNRLGEDGKGFDVMLGVVLPNFSLQNCAVSVGMMEGVLALAVSHVTNSKYSYDGSKIADLPQVRGHIAKMQLKIDLVRGLLLDALDAIEQGREDATLRVLESKLAGAETSLEVHDLAMRVCGGAAFRKDVGVERFFRDSRAAGVMAPVSDALYEFIGKAVCGMPVFG
jgi:alkylation response protein AidB-like acyl-CoA dehydrogenase